jgi:hypothetical protein
MPPKRKERESNPQGREAHPFSRRDTAPVAVLPRGDPGRPRTCTSPGKNRELCPLELRSHDVTGRGRTCDAPRFRRALYRAELRPRVLPADAVFAEANPASRRPLKSAASQPRSFARVDLGVGFGTAATRPCRLQGSLRGVESAPAGSTPARPVGEAGLEPATSRL